MGGDMTCIFGRRSVVAGILLWAVAMLAAWTAPDARAKMVKTGLFDEKGIQLYVWPELPKLEGWSQDMDSSYHCDCNIQAPVGFTYRNAAAVMYAVAVYKPNVPQAKTLEMFIERDIKRFSESADKRDIAEAEPLTTADGRKLRTFTFFARGDGFYERAAYAEEGDSYLVITLSGRSRAGYEKALADYERLVRAYREGREEPGPAPPK
jgi:hypothetical protein